jgi:hypothetical protein
MALLPLYCIATSPLTKRVAKHKYNPRHMMD